MVLNTTRVSSRFELHVIVKRRRDGEEDAGIFDATDRMTFGRGRPVKFTMAEQLFAHSVSAFEGCFSIIFQCVLVEQFVMGAKCRYLKCRASLRSRVTANRTLDTDTGHGVDPEERAAATVRDGARPGEIHAFIGYPGRTQVSRPRKTEKGTG